MQNRRRFLGSVGAAAALAGMGTRTVLATQNTPSYSLWWSEYPSWSVFGVAEKLGLINGKKGTLGTLEQKWGVDVVLKQADYEPCITAYGGNQADAVCITNMDVLAPSLSVESVAIAPTSTSFGADAILTTDPNWKEAAGDEAAILKAVGAFLKGKRVNGLEKSVSEYLVARILAKAGMHEKDVTFLQQDPGFAAQAMMTGQKGFENIVVWEPFVMQTLQTKKTSKVVANSTLIKGEIIDMVVVNRKVIYDAAGELLPDGLKFACCILDAYYEVNRWLANQQTRNRTLVALGEKFSSLNADQMADVLTRCLFFGTPEKGKAVYTDPTLGERMKLVTDFCVKHEITAKAPKISYTPGAKGAANLTFDTRILTELASKRR
jgi:NitT/TauT family transport system substrate-binding protein